MVERVAKRCVEHGGERQERAGGPWAQWFLAVAWLALATVGSVAAQGGAPATGEQDFEGKNVVEVVPVPVDADGRPVATPPQGFSADSITRILKTKTGQPFRWAEARDDLGLLWSRLKIIAGVMPELVDGGVRVVFWVKESKVYDRFEFRGLDHFTEKQVRALLGIDARQRLNERLAQRYALTLQDRYQREGYAWARVQLERDDLRSTLTFLVDEGPQVTIREVYFRGNRSFPSWAPLRLYDNLLGSAQIKSTPGVILWGAPYSASVVEEDLDRLRFFYRRQGYRDAEVELESVRYSDDLDEVDLTFRIFEGPRYRIDSIAIDYVLPDGRTQSLYPEDDLREVLQVRPGDYYDQNRLDIDKQAIVNFYGKRGHPQRGQFGLGIENAFEIDDPVEFYDIENATVRLTWQLTEGTPKILRDVRISGNTHTRDAVIRRRVFLFPGEILNMEKVQRSLRSLDSLRYFQDPVDFSGVSFELAPVDGEVDQVDLDIGLQEGRTGQFVWGAGVSTGAGVQARFVFNKRNFDISRTPSSWNPFTLISEVASNEAFHGAGQNLELMLAPGTEVSLFQVSFYEPDLFEQHFDTIGLRVQGFRRLRFLDTYQEDALGVVVGLERNFTENFSVGVSVRQETVDVEDPDIDAPTIVFDSEGGNELRGVRVSARAVDLDHPLRPTDGYDFRVYGEVVGGMFGADQDFLKAGMSFRYFWPFYRDDLDRAHVLQVRQRFDYGAGFNNSNDLFLTERFYMGGSTLRGFDQRRAGPSQFDNPLGGEARYLSTLEYRFPLVSTRMQGRLRQSDILRGVLFTDFGLLGTRIYDPTFTEPRLSVGVGMRITVPVLEVPIALDLGWPIVDEDTDRQRQFFFTLAY